MASYFEPISVLSLGAVLGLGHLPAQTLQDWFHGLAMGAINFENDPEKQRINDETAARIDTELRPLMERLRNDPDGSTIASMLTVDRMRTIEEVLPSLKVIILGGMQEPGHGAGSCLLGLLQDPGQLALVRSEPALWDDAVHEGLRWVAPIGTQTRQAAIDVEVAGTVIPAGAPVGAVVASACRDEAEFDDPGPVRHPPAARTQCGVRLRPALLRRPCLRPRAGAHRSAAARGRAAGPGP